MNTGIWKFAKRFDPQVEESFRLSLGEGNTPIEKIELEKGFSVWVKREDLNPTGSHKDRGLAYQISKHLQDGATKFAISSSGNSSISAVSLLSDSDCSLDVFLAESVSESKMNRLNQVIKGSNNVFIHHTNKPASSAFKFAQSENAVLLRGSTDPVGPEGYKTIAFEINEQIGEIDSIFIPASSATTAVGIHKGFHKINRTPKINIVQTTKVNPIARDYDKDFNQTQESIADSIVDRVAHRRDEIEKIINQIEGNAWVISDREIEEATQLLRKKGIEVSNDAALSIAGVIKSLKKGAISTDQKIVCLLTGKN